MTDCFRKSPAHRPYRQTTGESSGRSKAPNNSTLHVAGITDVWLVHTQHSAAAGRDRILPPFSVSICSAGRCCSKVTPAAATAAGNTQQYNRSSRDDYLWSIIYTVLVTATWERREDGQVNEHCFTNRPWPLMQCTRICRTNPISSIFYKRRGPVSKQRILIRDPVLLDVS